MVGVSVAAGAGMTDGASVAGGVVASTVTGVGSGDAGTVTGAVDAGVDSVWTGGSVVAGIAAVSGGRVVVAEVVAGKVGAIESGASSSATVPIGPAIVDVAGSSGALDAGELETMPLLRSSERVANTRPSTATTSAAPAKRPRI